MVKLQKVFMDIWIGPGDDVRKVCAEADKSGSYPDIGNRTELAVLNVADDYPAFEHHRDILYLHAGLSDGPEDHSIPVKNKNTHDNYKNAVLLLDALIGMNKKVLVHCHGGVSRSTSVVAIYIAAKLNTTFRKAVVMLNSIYPRANPHPMHESVCRPVIYELKGRL